MPDAINGVVSFDARGIRLDDVTTMGGGRSSSAAGSIRRLPARRSQRDRRGQDMQLRLFEGVRSTFDADLALVGVPIADARYGDGEERLWTRRIDAPGSIRFRAARRPVDR
jgi:hypothetical protein